MIVVIHPVRSHFGSRFWPRTVICIMASGPKRTWVWHNGERVECARQLKPMLQAEMFHRRAQQEEWHSDEWRHEVECVGDLLCWGMTPGVTSTSELHDDIVAGLERKSDEASCVNTWAAWSLAKQDAVQPTCDAIKLSRDAMDDRYSVESKMLGQGTFGVVNRGMDRRNGRKIAVKYVSGRCSSVISEVIMLCRLQHPNIVCVLDAFKTKEGCAIVLEYGGTALRCRYQKAALRTTDVAGMLGQIATGLAHVHDQSLIHADLKPDNILVDERDHVKIADFGNALIIGDPSRANMSRSQARAHGVHEVTVGYRAPEICFGEVQFSTSVDIWSLGCVGIEMVHRKPPFYAKSTIGVIHQILGKLGQPPEDDGVASYFRTLPSWAVNMPSPRADDWRAERLSLPDAGVKLLQSMLQWGPSNRPNANNVRASEFCHGWGVANAVLSVVSKREIDTFGGNYGQFSIRRGVMSSELLNWITNDEFLRTPAARAYPADECMEVKVEEQYLVKGEPPMIVNGKRTSDMLFGRLRAFVLAFIEVNRSDFERLDGLLKDAMRQLQNFEELGANVTKFLKRSLDEWLLPFASLQFLPVYEHENPQHNDGGLALLVLAIGLAGSRTVRNFVDGEEDTVDLTLSPGSVYIANVAAYKHQVIHDNASIPELTRLPQVPGLGICRLVCVVRCRVFQEQWSTVTKSKPKPTQAFDVANDVCQRWVRDTQLRMPTDGEVHQQLASLNCKAGVAKRAASPRAIADHVAWRNTSRRIRGKQSEA